MFHVQELVISFVISFLATLILVYPVKRWAVLLGAMDMPSKRKIHKQPIPRLGGLAIFLGVAMGFLYIKPVNDYLIEIIIGAFIIIITGILDDKYQLPPMMKLTGQILAVFILILSGLTIESINIPFFGLVELNYFSVIITFFWILGITNAVNLIDGLDGLAAGVSTIALISILVIAIMDQRSLVMFFCIVLIASNLGFLVHNFHPAKIYMGDTGSMFLGYSIAVISILGLFKNVTLFSFIIPIIVLAVPIFDTLFAMLRRIINKESIMMPDRKHIHYKLMDAGFSHRSTVLIIYAFSAVFGLLAVIFSNSSLLISLLICVPFLLLVHVFAEIVGVVGNEKRPMLKLLKRVTKKKN